MKAGKFVDKMLGAGVVLVLLYSTAVASEVLDEAGSLMRSKAKVLALAVVP